MEQNYDDRKALYNSGLNQINRLDYLWQMANNYAITGNLMRWNWILDTIWRELASDAKKYEIDKFYSFIAELVKHKNNHAMLYMTLDKKHIFLKDVETREGKGPVYKEDDAGL